MSTSLVYGFTAEQMNNVDPPTRLPAIPAISDIRDPHLSRILEALKERQEVARGERGSELDKNLTIRDLVQYGIVALTEDGLENLGSGGDVGGGVVIPPDIVWPSDPPDMSTPPAPTGFTVTGAYGAIILDWDVAPYGNHGHTEIWRTSAEGAPLDDIGQAVLVATAGWTAMVYTDYVGFDSKYYCYWIRFVSEENVFGPFNDVAGTCVANSPSVEQLLTELAGEIEASHLHADLQTRIDLIDTAGTGLIDRMDVVEVAASGNSSAITGLTTRVGDAETDILANAAAITALQATVGDPAEGNAALAAALTALDVRVTSNEGGISANASAVTTLQTTVGDHTTSIQVNATSIDGLEGKYTVKIDSNGYIAGYGLAVENNDGTPVSYWIAHVDKFAIGHPGYPSRYPFMVNDGAVYMDTALIRDGTIDTAKIGTAAITTAKIADGAIDTAKIADASIGQLKVKDASIIEAKIQDAAITTAKIKDAAVETLKIDGHAVTVPIYYTLAGKSVSGGGSNSSKTSYLSVEPGMGALVTVTFTAKNDQIDCMGKAWLRVKQFNSSGGQVANAVWDVQEFGIRGVDSSQVDFALPVSVTGYRSLSSTAVNIEVTIEWYSIDNGGGYYKPFTTSNVYCSVVSAKR